MTIISLNRLLAVVEAEAAVYKDTPFEFYIKPIISREESKTPLERHPPPYILQAKVTGITKIPNPDYDRYWERHLADPTEGEGAEIYKLRSEAVQLSREFERLNDEEGQIMATFEASREKQEALEAEHYHAIATGQVLGDRSMKRPPSSRGRPQVPFPWLALLGGLAIIFAVFGEAVTFSVPFLNMTGVDVSRLDREWRGNPIGVAGGAGFALAASAGMFLFWYIAIRTASSLAGSWASESPGMTGLKAVGVLLLGVVLVVFSNYMAGMRHGAAESFDSLHKSQAAQAAGHSETASEGMGGGIFVLLTLMVPFSAAYLQHRISKSAIWERRQALSAERDRWDREERERQLASDRLAGSMDLLQAKLNDIERRRDALRAKRRALEERIQTLAQQRLAALERERRDGLRFANDLYATLAQAHCLYIQAALRRKKYHLLVPPRDRLHEHSLALVPLERSNGRHGTRSPD